MLPRQGITAVEVTGPSAGKFRQEWYLQLSKIVQSLRDSITRLTIITNALNIALILGAVPGIAVHMPGGQFKAPTLSLSGDKSVEYFRNIFAGKLFLATAGVALEAGLTYPSFADLQLKEAMIKSASHVYLVADSSKINKSSFTRLGSLDVIHSFITDDGISDADAKAFEDRGIALMIAR